MPPSTKLTILFLAANPEHTDRTQLDEEANAIDKVLREAEFRLFDLRTHWALRYNDLSGLLMRYNPHIVHFSGHGSTVGDIALQDEQGMMHLIQPEALAALFSILRDNIRCVVLNACYSQLQAEGIARSIDFVVGMNRAISDPDAISFAAGFYRGLGYAKSIRTAFDLGCLEIGLANQGVVQTALRPPVSVAAPVTESVLGGAASVPQLVALRTDPAQVTLVDEAQATIPVVNRWRMAAKAGGSLAASDARQEKTKESAVGTRTSATISSPNEPRGVLPPGNASPGELRNPAGKETARTDTPIIESLSATIAEAAGHFERLSHLAKLIKAIDGLIIKHVPMCARFVGEYTPRCAALLARPDDYHNFADSLRDATGTLRNNLVEDVMLPSLQDVKFLEPEHKAIVNQIAQSVQLALAALESIDQLCSLVAFPTLETANIEKIGQALQQLAQHNADLDRLNILHKARTPIFVEVDKTVVRIEDVVKRLKKDIRTSKSKAGSAVRQAAP